MSNILITGINGFVGSNLSKKLKGNHSVFGLDIDNQISNDAIRNFSWRELDNIPLVNSIVHLAGISKDIGEKGDFDFYYKVNTDLTKRIFDYFLMSEAQKFIFFSSVKAAAHKIPDQVLTEEVVPSPLGPYGESKRRAEQYIFKNLSEAELKNKSVYILRPCMIHGPGNKGNLFSLYNLVRRGIPWPFGSFHNRRSFCAIDNVLYVVEELLTRDFIPNGVYNVSDDDSLSTNELMALFSESLGKPLRILNVPKVLIRGLAGVGGLLHLPFNSNILQKLTEDYVVSNSKVLRALSIERMPISACDGLVKTIENFN